MDRSVPEATGDQVTASMTITKWEGRPFDDQALEKERRERMADVVLVSELAEYYDRDPASVLKLLKRNEIELCFVADPVSGQRKRCVPAGAVEEVDDLMRGEHTVVSATDIIKARSGGTYEKDNRV